MKHQYTDFVFNSLHGISVQQLKANAKHLQATNERWPISKTRQLLQHLQIIRNLCKEDRDLLGYMADGIYACANSIPNLIAALEDHLTLPQNLEQVQVYNQNTYIDFHQLLLATAAGYEVAIDALVDKMTKNKEAAAKSVQLHAFLLWRISRCPVLKDHLCFLARAGLITLKNANERSVAEEKEDGKRPVAPDAEDAEEFDEGEEDAEEFYEGEKDAEEFDEGEEDAEDAEELDMSTAEVEDIPSLFLRWIRLVLDHFGSAYSLSKYVKKHIPTSVPVNIHLLVVNGSPRLSVLWGPVVESVLKRAGLDQELKMDHVLTTIEKYLAENQAGHPNKFTPAGTSQFFNKHVVVKSAIHCEAALAAMMKFSKGAVDSTEAWTVSTSLSFFL